MRALRKIKIELQIHEHHGKCERFSTTFEILIQARGGIIMSIREIIYVGCFILIGLFSTIVESTETSPCVLDIYSYWRSFLMLRPVVVAEKAETAQLPDGEPRTDTPPTGWTLPDFNDARWVRTIGPLFPGRDGKGYGVVKTGGGTCGSEEIALICLRGKFFVPDPPKVESLTLSIVYRGGIVVYVNGTEVARAHITGKDLTPETMGEEYPLEAYLAPDSRSTLDAFGRKIDTEIERRLKLRLRSLEQVSVPLKLLRKGVNVVAIEIHRSPVHPEGRKLKDGSWLTAGFHNFRLIAVPGWSIVSNTDRPKGIQVWNESILADIYDLDYGDPNEPLRPIELVGVRNGSFSGHVVVGSDKPIKGLNVRVSDLKTNNSHTIPVSAISLFYLLPQGQGGQEARSYRGCLYRPRFDVLAESPPAEVPLAVVKAEKGYSDSVPVPGAVQPIRVTVHVPETASEGDYEGMLSIKAEGMKEVLVPIKLRVIPWTLPPAYDFTSMLGIVQSIDTLAVYYNVPVWSERHWQLIDRSFRILGRAGVDVLFLPLVMKNHHGKEALVRWVKNDDGTYTHDFSLFDRYVDTALKYIKRPEIVCLYAWDRGYKCVPGRREQLSGKADNFQMPNVIVPLLDKKSGEVSEMKGPPYADPEAVGFWKPVLEGCRDRLKKRGVSDEAIVLGIVPDSTPAPKTIDNFYSAAPWLKWMNVSHAPGYRFKGENVSEVPVVCSTGVYGGTRPVPDPLKARYYAWKPWNNYARIFGVFPRIGAPYTLLLDTSLSACWTFQEAYLMTGVRGPMRIGGEFWNLTFKDGESERKTKSFISRYSGNIPGVSQAVEYMLAPGPDGPISTLRLETLYEGSQEGEARVFIEKALESGKGKLAFPGMSAEQTHVQLQELLDRRQRLFRAFCPVIEWYGCSNWETRSEELYGAAAKVAKVMPSK